MSFSEVLSKFNINELYKVENTILGLKGHFFLLENDIAYLYQEDREDTSSVLFIDSQRYDLDTTNKQKILSLLRLQQVKPRKLNEKDLWIYSTQIEDAMQDLLERRPDLVKGSSHMAFAPKNYTRFSENLLFDFHYIYEDSLTAETIMSFDEIFDTELRYIEYQHYEDGDERLWNDDHLYRYLLDQVRTTRESMNGQISPPEFLFALIKHAFESSEPRICVNLGPKIMHLKIDTPISSVFERKTSKKLNQLREENYVILEPNRADLEDIFAEIR